jgi:hypothetical protein
MLLTDDRSLPYAMPCLLPMLVGLTRMLST